MSHTVALPEQLAPQQLARVEALLAEVSLTTAPPLHRSSEYRGPRCVVCHGAGPLGGHHAVDGSVQWIHRSCHRRLHNRHKQPRHRRH